MGGERLALSQVDSEASVDRGGLGGRASGESRRAKNAERDLAIVDAYDAGETQMAISRKCGLSRRCVNPTPQGIGLGAFASENEYKRSQHRMIGRGGGFALLLLSTFAFRLAVASGPVHFQHSTCLLGHLWILGPLLLLLRLKKKVLILISDQVAIDRA